MKKGHEMESEAKRLQNRTIRFSREIDKVRNNIDSNLVVYNPLKYARKMHLKYIEEYAVKPVKILMLGMNPGPFGMAQNGIPFGDCFFVKNFLQIDEEIKKPKIEHPARLVQGLNCPRSEVSGSRLWGLLSQYYENKGNLVGNIYIANYCPLVFMENSKTAKNVTPDKLPKEIRIEIDSICDKYLWDTIKILKCEYLIGIGKYAEKKLKNDKIPYSSILHPSPASPLANKGWAEQASNKLKELGLW